MLTILIRTLLIYFFLICTMRMMGKRQIGELEVTDLVTTLLLSEIASLPITNQDIPVSHALIPMITLLALEVFSSYLLVKFPSLRFLFAARPTVIIQEGKLIQRSLTELRISIDELMSEIRQQGLTSFADVQYAILEKNGKLTVVPKARSVPPDASALGVSPPENSLMHIVYSNGSFSREGLRLVGKDETWLRSEFCRRGLVPEHLYCVTADSTGKLYWIQKENAP